jgi:ketosteroid isomerase-like protein
MSEENVEKMRQSLDAFDRGDRDAWLALRDQDHEIITSAAWPEAGAIRGREAAWEFYAEVAGAFDRPTFGGAELMDAGADKVLAHQRSEVRGRASGAEVELDYWVVISFREGKMIRDEWFSDRAEALEAAGLREW